MTFKEYMEVNKKCPMVEGKYAFDWNSRTVMIL
jgi:hypothetical protein